MKISVRGGGPGGLFAAILCKKADPTREVVVYERNQRDDTFGFGVVFSDDTMDNIAAADAEVAARMGKEYRHWSAIDVDHLGYVERSDGHAFAAMERKRLLQILGERAAELGVDVRYGTESPDLEQLQADSDLVIASDGVHSATRAALAGEFGATVTQRPAKYAWFATSRPVDCFRFIFRDTPYGLFWAHIYPFSETSSTFIVEALPQTWAAAGLDAYADRPMQRGESDEASMKFCADLFDDFLEGYPLVGNQSRWLNFNAVSNERWHVGNTVLIGDAAHTAHFSIGSGTKLAMEDAAALAQAMDVVTDAAQIPAALTAYENARMPVAASLQRSALTSLAWFEGIESYRDMSHEQFVFALLTRSQRITYDKLRTRDEQYVARLDEWFADNDGESASTPPMFHPFTIRGLTLPNRVVVSPMAQYSAVDGVPGRWHLVHLGSRAVGGAGLVLTEMTAVSPDGRITPGCPGIWTDEQKDAWAQIVDFVHEDTDARIGLQIGHAGPKGATKVMWEGIDDPLEEGAWEILAPSPLPYRPDSQVPRQMTEDDIDRVVADHAAAARRAVEAGFDLVEVHFAHGYLVSACLSPLTNERSDSYGGDIAGRATIGVRIIEAVRGVCGEDFPISVRISATDWADGGITDEDVLVMSEMFVDAGADLIDVSTGQTSVKARPRYGRLYQTPFADRIRNRVGVPTITVGGVSSVDDVNTIVLAGRADLCAIARPHLVDPYWTLNAALDSDYADGPMPVQYRSGRSARRRVQVP